MGLLDWLSLPQWRSGRDLDDPATTVAHAEIIRSKPYLRKLYRDFYEQFRRAAGETAGRKLVELGSGGGFLKEVIPNAITSDVLDLPGVDLRFSALEMPFEDQSIDGLFMIDVLHHIPDARGFFAEVTRCMRPGGRIVMIEPANTTWSRFIYRAFHHEPFDPDGGWSFPPAGPLSGANGAMPWIIFCRDRERFQREFPLLRILQVRPHTPLRYLISGGLRVRQLLPGVTCGLAKGLEAALAPLAEHVGMFMTIELQRRSGRP